MLTIKNADIYIFYLTLVMSVVPVIFIFGNVFTSEGRNNMKINPMIPIYFLLFIAYAYMFWVNPEPLQIYLHMSYRIRVLIYTFFCFIPLLRRDLPE